MSVTIEAPSDHFKLHIIGFDVPRDIFMSFGLLSELTTIVPDVDSLGQVHVVPEVRQAVLEAVLSARDEKGEITEKFTHHTVPLLPADAKALLNWVHRHIAAYFMDALQNMSETAGALQGVMETMMSSLPTTQDSTSEQPPPSPSE